MLTNITATDKEVVKEDPKTIRPQCAACLYSDWERLFSPTEANNNFPYIAGGKGLNVYRCKSCYSLHAFSLEEFNL